MVSLADQTDTAISADGTPIQWETAGSGSDFVLVPGLGVPPLAYRPFHERLGTSHRIITWQARGLYGAAMPESGRLGIEAHCDDLVAVIEASADGPVVLGGWSLAVPVCLEFARRYPDRCRGLVLINGPYKTPWPLGGVAGNLLARGAVRAISPFDDLIRWELRQAWRFPRVMRGLFRHSGIIQGDMDLFAEVAEVYCDQSFGVLARTIAAAQPYTARPYLHRLKMPVLVTLGTRDFLIPPAHTRHLAQELPNAELLEVEGASHWLPIEYPDALLNAVEGFVDGLEP